MKKIYISGKVSGLPIEEARENFSEAKKWLKSLGFEAVNPLEEVKDCDTWEEYMREDIKLLMDCDGIFMTKGWKESVGARIEYHLAMDLGMQIIY